MSNFITLHSSFTVSSKEGFMMLNYLCVCLLISYILLYRLAILSSSLELSVMIFESIDTVLPSPFLELYALTSTIFYSTKNIIFSLKIISKGIILSIRLLIPIPFKVLLIMTLQFKNLPLFKAFIMLMFLPSRTNNF